MRNYTEAGHRRTAEYHRGRAGDQNVLPTCKVPAILKLVDIVAAREGSEYKACQALGAAHECIRRWREGTLNMRVERARGILASYKKWKAAL